MSYGTAGALQEAVYQALAADSALGALVGGAIFDAVPSGPLPSSFVSLGPEEVRDRATATRGGAAHYFTVSVVTDSAGFQAAKVIAAAVSDALVGADLTLSRGALVLLRFDRASAKRDGDGRRIDLRFHAIVED